MRFSKSILITATAALLPLVSQAAPITPNPGPLSVADLSFNNFTCSLSKGGVSAFPSSCSQINVNTITQPGKGIQISSGFLAALGSFDDAVLSYNVSSKSGIDRVGLIFNGTFEGLAISKVTESVFSGENLVGFAQVSCDSAGCNRADNILLNGVYSNLHIQKDILVAASLGEADLSIVDQTFALTPEPASFAMLGVGLLGAGLLRRRKIVVKA